MFDVRMVALAPGGERPYDAAEWRDALVLVEQGCIELLGAAGGRRTFERGALLWLDGVPLRALANPGDEFHLGDDVGFSPVFWMDENAVAGLYTARFKLVDEEGLFGDSGEFEFRFAAVPEPSSALLLGGAMVFGLVRRRR